MDCRYRPFACRWSGACRKTEVVVQYPYAELFEGTHKRIIEEFAKVRPDIKVTLRAPYDSYEEGTQKVLREAVTSQMPDVTFQGLNRIRVLVDKNIPAELDGYIAAEKDFDKQGFHQAMFDIGTASGKVYALPFAISLPIVYVNLDLAKKAGADPANLPTDLGRADRSRQEDQGARPRHQRHHLRLGHHRQLAVAGAGVCARRHHAECR